MLVSHHEGVGNCKDSLKEQPPYWENLIPLKKTTQHSTKELLTANGIKLEKRGWGGEGTNIKPNS